MSGRTNVKWSRCVFGVAVAVPLLTLPAAPVGAHGDITSSRPEAGARLRKPPRVVRLVLAEPPAQGSDLTVIDACGEEVSGEPAIDGDRLSVSIEGGSRGRWRVQLRSISSVDGHAISDRFAFRVAGTRDCSPAGEEDDPGDAGDEIETSSRPPIENDEDSGFPVIPFALGTLVIVGAAVALRGRKS